MNTCANGMNNGRPYHKTDDITDIGKLRREYRLLETEMLRYKMDYFNTLVKVQDMEKKIADLEAKLAAATGGKDGE